MRRFYADGDDVGTTHASIPHGENETAMTIGEFVVLRRKRDFLSAILMPWRNEAKPFENLF
jgi:hypothetical protein